MQVFVTGASGWIGAATVRALVAAGHDVTGLARSDAAAAALGSAGVTALRGSLDDLESIRAGADSADAVIHLANKHDWSNPAATNAAERATVQAIGDVLVGSDRPFLLASGIAGLTPGRPATEDDRSPADGPDSPRGGSENLALEFAERGVRPVSLRFAPSVHGTGDHGFIAAIVAAARTHGVSGYPGDGTNRWAAVHRFDAADLIVRALEKADSGARVHAVAEPGIQTREIAEAIGRSLDLPVASIAQPDVQDHFGWIGALFEMDFQATSDVTRKLLGWNPSGPTLIEDIDAGAYSVREAVGR